MPPVTMNYNKAGALIDITADDSDEDGPTLFKDPFAESFDSQNEESQVEPEVQDFEPIDLTPEQECVARMALNHDNLFLTGAAGSGKSKSSVSRNNFALL